VVSDFGVGANQGDTPESVAIEANGQILVAAHGAGTNFKGALFRVDPLTGVRTIVSDFGVGANPGSHPRALALVPDLIQMVVDIAPGDQTNSINLVSNGVIPVAILTTDTLDATTIDTSSLRFGPNGAQSRDAFGHLEDVNGDGRLDLVVHFRVQETGIRCGDTAASLTGNTSGGQTLLGTGAFRILGCK
jgi:hypothetical protein